MSTKNDQQEKEVQLKANQADGYSPEMETSIWYN